MMSGLKLARAGRILSRQERRQSATRVPGPGMPTSMMRGPCDGGCSPPVRRGAWCGVVWAGVGGGVGDGGLFKTAVPAPVSQLTGTTGQQNSRSAPALP